MNTINNKEQVIYINLDDSGKLTRKEKVSVYGGIIFLSKDERDLYLNKINESIETLSNLISNVLKISKLDNESIKIEKSNYRLDEQIRQCILKFEDQLNKKNINWLNDINNIFS